MKNRRQWWHWVMILALTVPGSAIPQVGAAETQPAEVERDVDARDRRLREIAERYAAPEGAYLPMPLPQGDREPKLSILPSRLVSFDMVEWTETIDDPGSRSNGSRVDLPAPSEYIDGASPIHVDRVKGDDSRVGESSSPLDEATPRSFSALTLVANPEEHPFSVNVKVFMTFVTTAGNLSFAECSGVLIDPQHVLTAGHCVYAHDLFGQTVNNWARTITVAPAYDAGDRPYGSALATRLRSWTGWTRDGNYDHDMALIDLNRPVGALTGWHGYGYNDNADFFRAPLFHAQGYPGESPYNGQLMYTWGGSIDTVTKHVLRINNRAYGGQSGSGLYWHLLAARIVYGALSHGTGSYTGLTRIDSNKFNGIKLAMVLDKPLSCNVEPLDTNAAPSTISSGDLLSSLNFLALNYASGACSGSQSGEVYLSTDDDIDTSDRRVATFSYTKPAGSLARTRVNFSSPPRIPCDIDSGTYFLGIRLADGSVTRPDDTARVYVRAPSQVSVTTKTIPEGLPYTVDGQSFSTTRTVSWARGSRHTISAPEIHDPQNGTRYTWKSWSNGGARTQIVSTLCGGTYVARYDTQHRLDVSAQGSGAAEPGSMWVASGSSVRLQATPSAGFLFAGWTGEGNGSYTGCDEDPTVQVNQPLRQIARFGRDLLDTDTDGLFDTCDTCPMIHDPSGDADLCSEDQLFRATNFSRKDFSKHRIDGLDLFRFAQAFGSCRGDEEYESRFNLDRDPDQCVDGAHDLMIFIDMFGKEE